MINALIDQGADTRREKLSTETSTPPDSVGERYVTPGKFPHFSGLEEKELKNRAWTLHWNATKGRGGILGRRAGTHLSERKSLGGLGLDMSGETHPKGGFLKGGSPKCRAERRILYGKSKSDYSVGKWKSASGNGGKGGTA